MSTIFDSIGIDPGMVIIVLLIDRNNSKQQYEIDSTGTKI